MDAQCLCFIKQLNFDKVVLLLYKYIDAQHLKLVKQLNFDKSDYFL